METHDTIVIAWDGSGEVKFCKSFAYQTQKDETQAAFDYVSKNFPLYVMSDIQHFLHTKNFKEDHI